MKSSAAMTGNCEVTFNKVPNKRSCTKKNPDQPWFDEECNASMETLRHVSNQYKGSGHPLPPKYYGMNQAHQRLLSRKEARHRTKILDLITQSCGVDPHKWWSLLKQLNPATDTPFVPKEISASNWATHFQSLLNDPPQPSTGPHPTVTATEILKMARANIKGNQPITLAEVTKIVTNLRKNKAMYFDRVPNEMIQILHETQPTVLPILFNHILQTGLFPTEWSQAYLRPLYKKGNKLRPENYRGIAISPCLGKTFNAILNLSVEEIMDETGISNDMQIGFEKNHRIADHLFVIRTILDQAKICGQDTFMAFIDFKQAYDRVNRNLLFKKFLSNGLPSRIIKVVIDQYQNVQYCVLTPYGRTKFFKSNLGLKQGDTMSPRFFNLFIMDIISIFGNECNPHFLQGCAINVLLFADDLVLLSMSQEGLQTALDKLEEYCREWN